MDQPTKSERVRLRSEPLFLLALVGVLIVAWRAAGDEPTVPDVTLSYTGDPAYRAIGNTVATPNGRARLGSAHRSP